MVQACVVMDIPFCNIYVFNVHSLGPFVSLYIYRENFVNNWGGKFYVNPCEYVGFWMEPLNG